MIHTPSRRRTVARLLASAPAALVALLALAPSAAPGAETATLSLFHGPDQAASMTLKTLRMVLDGRDLNVPLPGADSESAVYSGPIAAGVHKLEVEADLEGSGAFFSYMDGYRVKMRSLLEVEVLEGEGVAIRSRIEPAGGMTAPWEERNRLVLTLSAAESKAPAPAVAAAAAEPVPVAAEPAPEPEPAPAVAQPAREPEPAPVAAQARREPEPVQVAARPRREPEPSPAAERAPEPVPVAKAEPQRSRAAPAPEPSPEPTPAPRAASATAPPKRARSVGPAEPSAPAEPAPAQRAARAAPSGDCSIPPLEFAFDSAALSGDARASLEGLAACVAATRARLRVEGHTDARGSRQYNAWLAWDRAAAVAAFLRSRGLPEGRVTTRFVGKARPLCADESEACYARNRRVEIIAVE
jgi:outer membrane protein OmpA-like peptidoglycan-associated protein